MATKRIETPSAKHDINIKLEGPSPEEAQLRSSREQQMNVLGRKEIISEVITPAEITPERITEVADYFRYVFNNEEPWGQYLVCPPCDSSREEGMCVGAREVFGTGKENVPIELMDNPPKMDCPCCQQPMVLFHDPEKTREKTRKKLEKEGYLSLLREPDDNSITGFALGYGSKTLEEVFELEWGNSYGYSANPDPRHNQDLGRLIDLLNAKFPDKPFTPDTEMLTWNCVALTGRARGGKNFVAVMQRLFNAIPEDKHHMRIVAEVMEGSAAHGLFHMAGGVDVPGFMPKGSTNIVFEVGETTRRFSLSQKEFYKLRRQQRG